MHAPDILFIEDNDGDVTLMQAAFRQTWPGVNMHTVSTVQKAESFIARHGLYADAPDLSLILLDLNLPGGSGTDLLRRLQGKVGERRIPIVVFSASCRQQEIEECYRLGASLYVVKPNHWNGYIDLAASFAKLAALSG